MRFLKKEYEISIPHNGYRFPLMTVLGLTLESWLILSGVVVIVGIAVLTAKL